MLMNKKWINEFGKGGGEWAERSRRARTLLFLIQDKIKVQWSIVDMSKLASQVGMDIGR